MKQDLPLEATVLVCQALVPHLLPFLLEMIISVIRAVNIVILTLLSIILIRYGMAEDVEQVLPAVL